MDNGRKILMKELVSLLGRKGRVFFLVVLLLLAVTAVLSQLTPLALGFLTDSVLSSAGASFSSVIPVLVFILVVNLVNEVLKVVRRILVEDAATSTEEKARIKATEALLKAPMSYFRTHMTGNIYGRLNRSIEGTSKLVKLVFMDFAPSLATGIAAIAVIFTSLPFLVALSIILVIPVGLFIVFRQISTQRGIRVSLLEGKAGMDGTMVELLGGIETIRTLDTTDRETGRIGVFSEKLRRKEMKHHVAMAGYDLLKFANEVVFSVLVIASAVFLAFRGDITVGTILTAYLCFTQLTGPLRELHRILDEASEALVLAEDFFSLVSIVPDFSYLDETGMAKGDGHAVRIGISSFSYEENPGKKILGKVDLTIPEGMYLGLAGPSGSGKSTLVKLVAKLERGEGNIFVGGRPLSDFSRGELSRILTLVPQQPFIITGTIRENVIYGLDRTPSDVEVMQALEKANLGDFVSSKPDGLDFLVSEAGENLSGGQRQRLALSRIFLRRMNVLILDEATSALDNVSEARILSEIERMNRQGTTVIAIAHRLTALRNTDCIVVMKDGLVEEEGSYEELASAGGIFSDMLAGRTAY